MAPTLRPVYAADGLEIVDHPAALRYEARLEGEPAGLIVYELDEGWMVIDHTEVFEAFEGRGIGTRLAKAVLDDVRARGLRVDVQCPFVTVYLRKHPEYGDLVRGAPGLHADNGQGP